MWNFPMQQYPINSIITSSAQAHVGTHSTCQCRTGTSQYHCCWRSRNPGTPSTGWHKRQQKQAVRAAGHHSRRLRCARAPPSAAPWCCRRPCSPRQTRFRTPTLAQLCSQDQPASLLLDSAGARQAGALAAQAQAEVPDAPRAEGLVATNVGEAWRSNAQIQIPDTQKAQFEGTIPEKEEERDGQNSITGKRTNPPTMVVTATWRRGWREQERRWQRRCEGW